jgi:spermidine synthase
MKTAPPPLLYLLAFGSGLAALIYEGLWMRRFALLCGGGALASALTVAALFGGLGLGGLLGGRLRAARPARAWAVLEALAALWALSMPWLITLVEPWVLATGGLGPRALAVTVLSLPPALALGATLPALARGLPDRAAITAVYTVNTLGAVVGVLLVPWVLLPLLGVVGAERLAASAALTVAWGAWGLPIEASGAAPGASRPPSRRALFAAGLAGLISMALEVCWMRLAAALVGPSIYAFSMVLAVFLAGVAGGAALGRRLRHPATLPVALGMLGVSALLGAFSWGQAPVLLAAAYPVVGPGGMGLVELLLAVLTMGGAPVASGVVFARALDEAGGDDDAATGGLYGVNTLLGVVGSAGAGLWLIPTLGVQGATGAAAALAGLGAALLSRKPGWLAAPLVLWALLPAWDGKLYAVGVYSRVSDLADHRPEAVRRFAEEGWTLRSYQDGLSAAVAVGKSDRSGNLWLSINGKVDASTGDDMPTQLLSGQLPARLSARPQRVFLVGLASGVTAGAVLAEPGVEALTVVELEPEVVAASRLFDAVSGAPLEDPRVTLLVEDARAVLSRAGPKFDVIISEPSNPWITGVSNLFTLEYWRLGAARLSDGGVFCQWVQLYGLAPSELRTLVRTFTAVFPQAWLYETLPGADALLIGRLGDGPAPPIEPIPPRLGPAGLKRLSVGGQLNTDDRPWVELRAPRSQHYNTAPANEAALAAAEDKGASP